MTALFRAIAVVAPTSIFAFVLVGCPQGAGSTLRQDGGDGG